MILVHKKVYLMKISNWTWKKKTFYLEIFIKTISSKFVFYATLLEFCY